MNLSLQNQDISRYIQDLNTCFLQFEEGTVNDENVNHFIVVGFAFVRDFKKNQLYNKNKEYDDLVKKITLCVKTINVKEEIKERLTPKNKEKLDAMNYILLGLENLPSIKGGKKRKTYRRRVKKHKYSLSKKSYKKRKTSG